MKQQNLFNNKQVPTMPFTKNDKRIKVLTLWQPYATLFLHQVKVHETRPKPTSHKGIYLIHAAKQMNKVSMLICEQEPFKSELKKLGYNSWEDLPTGCILGGYEQKKCYQISDVYLDNFDGESMVIECFDKDSMPHYEITTQEDIDFGDFAINRWFWQGDNFRELLEPLPYTNGQGYYRNFQGNYSKLIFK